MDRRSIDLCQQEWRKYLTSKNPPTLDQLVNILYEQFVVENNGVLLSIMTKTIKEDIKNIIVQEIICNKNY